MSKASPGTVVRIHYDTHGGPRDPAPGDTLVTPTGRAYAIITSRKQERGKWRGRYHLQCVVLEEPPPPGDGVWTLRWNRREKKER